MYLSDIGDSPHRNIIHCLCGTLHNYYELNFTNYLINMYYTIYCNTLDLLTFITQNIITLIQYQNYSQYYR